MNDFLYNNLRATAHGSLAQLDRATHYECVGRGFESLMAHHFLFFGVFGAKYQKNDI